MKLSKDPKAPQFNSDEEKLWKAVDWMWEDSDIYSDKKALEEHLARATRGERAVFACSDYMAEVGNGGHFQFFDNSTGILWEEALKGLSVLGAEEYKVVLEKAVSFFDNNHPPKDRGERQKALGKLPENTLSSLDDEFYRLNDSQPLKDFFERYFEENLSEFPHRQEVY
ncbi:DUF4375 domain-containing protein [Patescibacteria group bacterium]